LLEIFNLFKNEGKFVKDQIAAVGKFVNEELVQNLQRRNSNDDGYDDKRLGTALFNWLHLKDLVLHMQQFKLTSENQFQEFLSLFLESFPSETKEVILSKIQSCSRPKKRKYEHSF